MTYVVAAVSALLAVVFVLALAREVRLRRAIQKLLSRIFQDWRECHATPAPSMSHIVGGVRHADGGAVHHAHRTSAKGPLGFAGGFSAGRRLPHERRKGFGFQLGTSAAIVACAGPRRPAAQSDAQHHQPRHRRPATAVLFLEFFDNLIPLKLERWR